MDKDIRKSYKYEKNVDLETLEDNELISYSIRSTQYVGNKISERTIQTFDANDVLTTKTVIENTYDGTNDYIQKQTTFNYTDGLLVKKELIEYIRDYANDEICYGEKTETDYSTNPEGVVTRYTWSVEFDDWMED